MKKTRHVLSPSFGTPEYFEWVLNRELDLFWIETDNKTSQDIIDKDIIDYISPFNQFNIKNVRHYKRYIDNISSTLIIFNLDRGGDTKFSLLNYSKDGKVYITYKYPVYDLILMQNIDFGKKTFI